MGNQAKQKNMWVSSDIGKKNWVGRSDFFFTFNFIRVFFGVYGLYSDGKPF